MSLISKLTQVARSPKGQQLVNRAKHIANDPKTREKIESAKEKIGDQLSGAKQKVDHKRGEHKPDAPDDTPPSSYGDGPKAA